MKMMQNNLNDQITEIMTLFLGETNSFNSSNPSVELEFDRLTVAARAGDTDLFQKLVLAEQANGTAENQPTLLMAAVMNKRLEIVQALIHANADVNAKYQQGFTFDALSFAVSDGSTDIVRILLNAGADPNWNNQNPGLTPIREACQKGYAQIVRLLLDAGATVKFGTGFRLLTDAAEKSTPDIVQMLIDAGCNVNTKDQDTPLTAACRLARTDIVQILLANSANPNKAGMHDMTPLTMVFLAPKMVHALSAHGLAEGTNDLPSRIFQIVMDLLAAGAEADTYDVMGNTPLMLALEQSNLAAAEILLNAGASVNLISQPNSNSIFLQNSTIVQKTALQLAIDRNDQTSVDFLVSAGATLNTSENT
jgi:ankyrin repeat protein